MVPIRVGFVEHRFPRRRKWMWAFVLAAAIPLTLLGMVFLYGLGGMILFSLSIAFGLWLNGRVGGTRSGPAPISFDRRFLALPDEFVALDRILNGFVVPPVADAPASIVLDLVDGSTVVLGLGAPEAEALLGGLRLRPDQRMLRFPLAAPLRQGPTDPYAVAGSDGLRIQRFGNERFVPFASILAVATEKRSLVIRRREGMPVYLPMVAFGGEHVRALRQRIAQAVASRHGSDGVEALLGRRDQPIAEWRAALATLTQRETDFRRPSYRVEDLARVLDDGIASPEVRVGAAVALQACDPDAAVRIRVAASETADAALRDAFEAIAAEEPADALVERALRPRW